jgi:hypothetical protein
MNLASRRTNAPQYGPATGAPALRYQHSMRGRPLSSNHRSPAAKGCVLLHLVAAVAIKMTRARRGAGKCGRGSAGGRPLCYDRLQAALERSQQKLLERRQTPGIEIKNHPLSLRRKLGRQMRPASQHERAHLVADAVMRSMASNSRRMSFRVVAVMASAPRLILLGLQFSDLGFDFRDIPHQEIGDLLERRAEVHIIAQILQVHF